SCPICEPDSSPKATIAMRSRMKRGSHTHAIRKHLVITSSFLRDHLHSCAPSRRPFVDAVHCRLKQYRRFTIKKSINFSYCKEWSRIWIVVTGQKQKAAAAYEAQLQRSEPHIVC